MQPINRSVSIYTKTEVPKQTELNRNEQIEKQFLAEIGGIKMNLQSVSLYVWMNPNLKDTKYLDFSPREDTVNFDRKNIPNSDFSYQESDLNTLKILTEFYMGKEQLKEGNIAGAAHSFITAKKLGCQRSYAELTEIYLHPEIIIETYTDLWDIKDLEAHLTELANEGNVTAARRLKGIYEQGLGNPNIDLKIEPNPEKALRYAAMCNDTRRNKQLNQPDLRQIYLETAQIRETCFSSEDPSKVDYVTAQTWINTPESVVRDKKPVTGFDWHDEL